MKVSLYLGGRHLHIYILLLPQAGGSQYNEDRSHPPEDGVNLPTNKYYIFTTDPHPGSKYF